jgi:phosphate-selective porin
MKLKSILVSLAVAVVPSCAHAQNAVTNADAQVVIETIRGDEAKTQAYCDSIKLGDQIEQADQKGENTEEMNRKMDQLGAKLGPEYGALMEEYRDIDPSTPAGQEAGARIQTTIEVLNKLCGPTARRSGRD